MAGKRNKEKLYEVEGIVDERDINGKMEYKVHWKGYADSEDSWEPEANLKQCKDIIEEYRAGKVSSSGRTTPPATTQTVLLSDEEPATPKRQRRSLKRSSHSRSRSPSQRQGVVLGKTSSSQKTPSAQVARRRRDYSPGRYYLRSRSKTVTQRVGLSSDEEGETPLQRRRLSTERAHIDTTSTTVQDTEQSTAPPPTAGDQDSATQPGEQTDADGSPMWMQLGYAELFFCLAILAVIIGIIWYISTQNFKITL